MMSNLYNLDSQIKELIQKAPGTEGERQRLLEKWNKLRQQRLNIIITGATGCGKSSTINALFSMGAASVTEVATVGTGPDPETMKIVKYEIGNMTLWDSPGLGDGKEADVRHSEEIIKKLQERDSEGNYLIDLVLVILDGSTRDLGTSYDLINKVIIPNLGEKVTERILVAINQSDVAMKGRHWDYQANKPDDVLVKFLEEKCNSVKNRIYEATGVNVDPIYYTAGGKEEGQEQERPYNLTKLLVFILKHIPAKKRLVLVNEINKDSKNWKDNDRDTYGREATKLTAAGVTSWMAAGGALGAAVGTIIPGIGTVIGGAVGTVIGGAIGFFKGLFD